MPLSKQHLITFPCNHWQTTVREIASGFLKIFTVQKHSLHTNTKFLDTTLIEVKVSLAPQWIPSYNKMGSYRPDSCLQTLKKKVLATVVLIEECRIRFFVIRVSTSHLVLCQAANSDYKTFQDSVALSFFEWLLWLRILVHIDVVLNKYTRKWRAKGLQTKWYTSSFTTNVKISPPFHLTKWIINSLAYKALR